MLILSNHQSFFDPWLIGMSTSRYLTYLARNTLFRRMWVRWLIDRNLFDVLRDATLIAGRSSGAIDRYRGMPHNKPIFRGRRPRLI